MAKKLPEVHLLQLYTTDKHGRILACTITAGPLKKKRHVPYIVVNSGENTDERATELMKELGIEGKIEEKEQVDVVENKEKLYITRYNVKAERDSVKPEGKNYRDARYMTPAEILADKDIGPLFRFKLKK